MFFFCSSIVGGEYTPMAKQFSADPRCFVGAVGNNNLMFWIIFTLLVIEGKDILSWMFPTVTTISRMKLWLLQAV